MEDIQKIGFGGGCHWCTEAVFSSLNGVLKVEQGFIAPKGSPDNFSEAVIVHFDEYLIRLKDLIEIHLYTHKSTHNHSMRTKYRSAIYCIEKHQKLQSIGCMDEIQKEFSAPLITKVLPFGSFYPSEKRFQNYYYQDTKKPFCEKHISPKISLLMKKFSAHVSDSVIRANN